ncbi:hypothetical protein [Peterkaempfera griseoplana]|uniref:hypothetical protein n=1 Tax=Peterkaempfera griseoplana TaxID=66896 RepID=UPI0007C76C01|nr:hypothetical protein [Peterkaempfera griseoplana]
MDEAAEAGTDTPPSGPAHARSGPVHWAVTAAAVGAVIATAVVGAPAEGAPRAVRSPAPGHAEAPVTAAPAVAPDPSRVQLPLDCGPFPVKAAHRFSADLDGDGRPETVVAAHCDGTNGTPPDGVYVLAGEPAAGASGAGSAAGGSAAPRIAATLVRPQEDLSVTELESGPDGTVVARVQGYSGVDVARCCPDVNLILTWARAGSEWIRAQASAPAPAVG